MVEPPNLPLFEVGNLSKDLENKVKNDSKQHRENKIINIKDNQAKALKSIEDENIKDIEQMRLKFEDLEESQNKISDIEL